MTRRLADLVVLLYPRRVRERHGPEIVALIDDLVAHEGRSRAALCVRLAMDGLVQRVASVATIWTAAAILATTSFGGLVVADLAAASARHGVSHPSHTITRQRPRPEVLTTVRQASARRAPDLRLPARKAAR
jgi:hypothetical protein